MTQNKFYEETPSANQTYIAERDLRIKKFKSDEDFINLSRKWREDAIKRKYMNNFSWLGRPLIQFPGDIMAVQELISTIKPNKIIETGIAHGGSLILSSSMLFLNEIKNAEVIGIDIEIREHNKIEIKKSRFSNMISLIEGSSIDQNVFEKVSEKISNDDKDLLLRLKIVGTTGQQGDSNPPNIRAFIRSQAEGVAKKANFLRVFCSDWGSAVVHIESRSGHEEDDYFSDTEDNIRENTSKLLNT